MLLALARNHWHAAAMVGRYQLEDAGNRRRWIFATVREAHEAISRLAPGTEWRIWRLDATDAPQLLLSEGSV
jgi:hypothetical protein